MDKCLAMGHLPVCTSEHRATQANSIVWVTQSLAQDTCMAQACQSHSLPSSEMKPQDLSTETGLVTVVPGKHLTVPAL